MPTSQPAKETPPLPRNLLLATDLSCRCDRALDRAIATANAWNAHLTALMVVDQESLDESRLEGAETEDPVQKAARRLRKDTASLERSPSVLIRTGDVVEQLLDVVSGNGMDLVVTGVARNQWLRAVTLGSVVDGLLRHSRVPTLVVRNRVHGNYRRILVAGDFSPLSRHLLETTLAFFPDSDIAFFHAFEVPYIDLADANRDLVREQARRTAQQEATAFLETVRLPASHPYPVRAVCEYGVPVAALNAYSQRNEIDLVVIGNHGRGLFFEILIGSKSRQILQNIESDVMVVPEPAEADGSPLSPDPAT